MGYYSYHCLNVYNKQEKLVDQETYDKVVKEYEKVTGELGEYIFEDTVKWYSEEADSLKVSELFPEYYLEITREGEDRGDTSKTVYLNGRIVAQWYLHPEEPSIKELLTKYKK